MVFGACFELGFSFSLLSRYSLNVVSRVGRRRKYSTSVVTTTSSEKVNTTLTRPQRGRLHLPFSCRPFEAPGGALELHWALGSYPEPCLSDSTGPFLTCLRSPRQSTAQIDNLTRHIYGVECPLTLCQVTDSRLVKIRVFYGGLRQLPPASVENNHAA